MNIKSFEDWFEENNELDLYIAWENPYSEHAIKEAYDSGVKEASIHYEEEKVRIHEYYSAKMAELFGEDIFKGSEENNGRLT